MLVKDNGESSVSFNGVLTDQEHPSYMQEGAAWEMSQINAAAVCFWRECQ